VDFQQPLVLFRPRGGNNGPGLALRQAIPNFLLMCAERLRSASGPICWWLPPPVPPYQSGRMLTLKAPTTETLSASGAWCGC